MRYRYAQGDDGGEEGCGSWVWNQLDAIYAWRSTQKRARTSRSTPALTPMHSRAHAQPSPLPLSLLSLCLSHTHSHAHTHLYESAHTVLQSRQSQDRSLPSAPCQPRCGTRLEQQSRGDWSEAVGRHIRYQQRDFASWQARNRPSLLTRRGGLPGSPCGAALRSAETQGKMARI